MSLMQLDLSKLKKASVIEQERLIKLEAQVRAERDKRIAATDYFLLPDAPTAPDNLLAYRQALRDITEQPGFPEQVIWPELPSA